MPITFACPHCYETLQLAEELAGKEGACRFCGGTFRIPAPGAPASPLALAQASVEQIVEELARRGQHAVLTLVSPVGDAAKETRNPLSEALQPNAALRVMVRHLNTAGLTAAQSRALLAMLSQVQPAAPPADPSPAPPAATPPPASAAPAAPPPSASALDSEENFVFKGDPLGMKLSEFKLRHERVVPGRRSRMPWCSDETPNGRIPALKYEPWQATVGIVHARVDLPEENSSPTIGGAPTEAVIYQFVDDRLFQVTGFFATDDFPKVSHALRVKYGEPQSEEQNPYRLQWWRGESTIELTHGRIHPREPSVFRCFHDDLLDDASQRQPDTTADL